MSKIKDFLLDIFFPRFCFGCQKEESYLCQDCLATLDILENFYCLCDKNSHLLLRPGKCKKCSSKKLSGLYFALSYKENLLTKKIIKNFKYQPYLKDLAKTLSSIIIEHFLLTDQNFQEICKESILIPVPLDGKKLKKRGFNQTEEISKELSKILKIPLISGNLIKIKKTLPQVKLSGKEREENVKNAFFVKNSAGIKQKKVFLVDDVYTTGSTMEEAAKVLKKAGAKEVWGVAVTREEQNK